MSVWQRGRLEVTLLKSEPAIAREQPGHVSLLFPGAMAFNLQPSCNLHGYIMEGRLESPEIKDCPLAGELGAKG
jgi:hypothetical protein